MNHKNRKLSIIKYLLSGTLCLTLALELTLFVLNMNDLESLSFVDVRNIVFYLMISFLQNLILLSLLSVVIIPIYKKYQTSSLMCLITALPLFVVMIPHILVWIAYSPVDDKLSTMKKLLFYLAISFLLMLTLFILAKILKLAQIFLKQTKMINRLLKISLVVYSGLLLVFLSTAAITSIRYDKSKTNSPNIMLIVVDALRKDFLGSYGFPLDVSPNLDNLAASGILFKNAFTVYPGSVPGHTSILFGESIEEHKVLNNRQTVSSQKEAIAEILKNQGYYTFGVCQNPLISSESGFAQGFETYWTWGKEFISNAPIAYYFCVLPVSQILTKALEIDLINTYTKMLIKRNHQPFFGFIQYLYCHDPYKDYNKPRWLTKENMEKVLELFESGELPNKSQLPIERVVRTASAYIATVRYVDSLIQALKDDLSKKDLLKNTFIIVTADHGENLAEHGEGSFGSHGGYYNTSLEIPLIVWSPDIALKGVEIAEITSQEKIKDLILDIISKYSLFFSKDPDIEALINLMCKDEHFAFANESFILFNNSYKYVTNVPGEKNIKKLFRWRDDYFDENNIYDANNLVVDRMENQLSTLLTKYDVVKFVKQKKKLTREQIKRLKALGYFK
jgi:hypothetical protein